VPETNKRRFMARFSLKVPIRLIVRGAGQSVIPNPSGIPMVVNTPSVVVTLKAGINDITDQEIIDRIRRDQQYNTPEGMIEITEDEIEATHIKSKKMKEADEEIRDRKNKKPKV